MHHPGGCTAAFCMGRLAQIVQIDPQWSPESIPGDESQSWEGQWEGNGAALVMGCRSPAGAEGTELVLKGAAQQGCLGLPLEGFIVFASIW